MKLSIKSKGDNILYLISKKSNMTVVASWTGTAYPPGEHGFNRNSLSSQRTWIQQEQLILPENMDLAPVSRIVRIVHFIKFYMSAFLFPCCDVRYDFFVKTKLGSSWLPFYIVWVFEFFVVIFVFIYAYWCSQWFPYHTIFLAVNSNKTAVTSGAGTAYPLDHLS
jgi:hypothetical protein